MQSMGGDHSFPQDTSYQSWKNMHYTITTKIWQQLLKATSPWLNKLKFCYELKRKLWKTLNNHYVCAKSPGFRSIKVWWQHQRHSFQISIVLTRTVVMMVTTTNELVKLKKNSSPINLSTNKQPIVGWQTANSSTLYPKITCWLTAVWQVVN